MKLKDGFKGERCLVLPKAITDMIRRDPLASLIYITDIGFYPAARHHFRRRDTPIPQYVFIYCVNGRGWYEIGTPTDGGTTPGTRTPGTVRHAVHRNQYFILPADVPHAYGSDDTDPWTIYWIHFSGSLAPHYAGSDAASYGGAISESPARSATSEAPMEGIFSKNPARSAIRVSGPIDITPSMESRINVRNNLFEEIFRTLSTSFSIESIRYAMASFHHYLASLRYIAQFRTALSPIHSHGPSASLAASYGGAISESPARSATPESSDMDRRFPIASRSTPKAPMEGIFSENPARSATPMLSPIDLERLVTHYFAENMERSLTLREVADYVGLSTPALSAKFKAATGHAPLQYFNLMKVRRACELLDTTPHSIAQISMKLGIEDPYYFSRLFSKTMGLSPKAYRNRQRP